MNYWIHFKVGLKHRIAVGVIEMQNARAVGSSSPSATVGVPAYFGLGPVISFVIEKVFLPGPGSTPGSSERGAEEFTEKEFENFKASPQAYGQRKLQQALADANIGVGMPPMWLRDP